MLGTGVTYCQGELNNIESLEYALTDVDKIVFCESPPRKDELDYQSKFDQFVQETLNTSSPSSTSAVVNSDDTENHDIGSMSSLDKKELEIQQLSELMEMKARIAEQVDYIGMRNVLQAYQNVRHADYGTSQAAKRSLFKFQSREEDFNLFSISYDDNDQVDMDQDTTDDNTNDRAKHNSDFMFGGYNTEANYDYVGDTYGDEHDAYSGEDYSEYNDYPINRKYSSSKKSKVENISTTTTMKTQVNWMRNKFKHGVFVGKLPSSTSNSNGGTEASIISSRLRSREDPEKGIDLSNGGFAGFICRVCADGRTYEAFVRTSKYEECGVEYVCKFQAKAKKASQIANGNRSVNKFSTVRLPFTSFTPVLRFKQHNKENLENVSQISFDGNDIKQLGFRVKSVDNAEARNSGMMRRRNVNKSWVSFYLAFSYIKVYRSQPEPEFIYFSDARLGEINENMIDHRLKQVIIPERASAEDQEPSASISMGATIFDEKEAKRVISNQKDRSEQELYYKYCGEEMLKNSGLSYSIIRIPGLNELASGEFSTLRLKQVSLLGNESTFLIGQYISC